MADYKWPSESEQGVLGRRLNRLDGPIKSTGLAKYTYDLKIPEMLHAKILKCPHAHARITRIDTAAASTMPGVHAVHVIQDVGTEVQWALDEVVAIAAETEDQARDALRAVEIDYEVLPHFVLEEDLASAPEAKAAQESTQGDPEQAFALADHTIEVELGLPQMAHQCLEAHGQIASWEGDQLTVWASTQGVSTLPFQFAEPLGIQGTDVRILCDYMGGGFGSKFSPERWGIVCARLAKETGRPVKLFLDRDQEVAVAGSRPSSFAKVRVGASAEGKLTAWESASWGSGGRPGSGAPPLPYLFGVPARRSGHTSVPTHFAGARAWRAPNHPQACFVTMSALDEMAHELGLDPLDFVLRNLELTPRAELYREQLEMAAEKIEWRERWRPREERTEGPLQRGLGLSLHTWSGRGGRSSCQITIQPDGSVEGRIGTQDLGTGTRTVVAMVMAETFGLQIDQVRVHLGDSRFPASDPSGGSSTVGGVSASTRRAAQDALEELLGTVAPELGVEPTELEARDGVVRVAAEPDRQMSWRRAAGLLAGTPIVAQGRNPGRGRLNDSGVGGVQMADVTVDLDTGVVRVHRMVAIQDCGLVVNRQLADSQMHGGLIMGIGYALYEEWIPDPGTGRLLNADMENYRLAGLVDVGELDVHLMSGDEHTDRGVIGLGEPPVISPGAAIANAVTNATGVRMARLPLTPDRVLDALASGGAA